jgi:hypothetical protein
MSEEKKMKPRKHKNSWSSFCFWKKIFKVSKAMDNRISAIKDGRSNTDIEYEKLFAGRMAAMEKELRKELAANVNDEFGEVAAWFTSIKGVGEHTAAKVLCPIDDIAHFDSISKFWRFCGLAVIDGKAERGTEHYCRKIKSALVGDFGIADQIVRHHAPLYVDIYYEEKDRLHNIHPDFICDECGAVTEKKGSKSSCCNAKVNYTDAHINNMAYRKVAKELMKHLWIVWRTVEELPVSKPHPEDDVIGIPNLEVIAPEDDNAKTGNKV